MIIVVLLSIVLLLAYLVIGSVVLYHLFKYRLPPLPLFLSHQPKDKTIFIATVFIVVSLIIISLVVFLIATTPWKEATILLRLLIK